VAAVAHRAWQRAAERAGSRGEWRGWEPGGLEETGRHVSSVVGAAIPADVADFASSTRGGRFGSSHGYGVIASPDARRQSGRAHKTMKAAPCWRRWMPPGYGSEVIHDGLLRYKALVAFRRKGWKLGRTSRATNGGEELRAAIAPFGSRTGSGARKGNRGDDRFAAASQVTPAGTDRLHRTVSLFVESLPARAITMPKPEETRPGGAGPIRAGWPVRPKRERRRNPSATTRSRQRRFQQIDVGS
jgi:hypothetical protein